MRKIPTLFLRDPQDMKRLLAEVNPACAWVLDGEGVATRKYDGTCVILDDASEWWARREVKAGKSEPAGFKAEQFDPATGKTVGWEPMAQSSFARYFAEALEPLTGFGGLIGKQVPPGTYELIGPKINGNPEGARWHRLQSHANAEQIKLDPWQSGPGMEQAAYDAMRDLLMHLAEAGWEGIVWHHPDGRMAKVKARDFGIEIPA